MEYERGKNRVRPHYFLSKSELTPEPFTAQLRGLIEERTLYRVQILKQVQL